MATHSLTRGRADTPRMNDAEEISPANVEEIVRLEQRYKLKMGWSDQLASLITAFTGSMLFVAIHVVWIGAWVFVNLRPFGMPAFDPYPFGLLTMIGSLEAIFLSTFVLISQNRQMQQADRRAKVNLQVSLIAEQEVTKLIGMVAELQDFVGMHGSNDPQVRRMLRSTHVSTVAEAIDEAEEQIDPHLARGPGSAVDTEG